MTAELHPERALALSYAAAPARAGLDALLSLDETLGQILRTTREPMVGQMRLTWWHEALCALDTAPPPAQPVLQALADTVLPHGIDGSRLATMIDGWEILLEPDPLDTALLESYADRRGGTLFTLAGELLGARDRDPVRQAGNGWALADLARHSRDVASITLPQSLAQAALDAAMRHRWSPATRPLGALALTARMDLQGTGATSAPVTSPSRIARLAWHRLTGR